MSRNLIDELTRRSLQIFEILTAMRLHKHEFIDMRRRPVASQLSPHHQQCCINYDQNDNRSHRNTPEKAMKPPVFAVSSIRSSAMIIGSPVTALWVVHVCVHTQSCCE